MHFLKEHLAAGSGSFTSTTAFSLKGQPGSVSQAALGPTQPLQIPSGEQQSPVCICRGSQGQTTARDKPQPRTNHRQGQATAKPLGLCWGQLCLALAAARVWGGQGEQPGPRCPLPCSPSLQHTRGQEMLSQPLHPKPQKVQGVKAGRTGCVPAVRARSPWSSLSAASELRPRRDRASPAAAAAPAPRALQQRPARARQMAFGICSPNTPPGLRSLPLPSRETPLPGDFTFP